MAAKQNNCGKNSKPSNTQSRFSIPHKKRVDEPPDTKDNDSISYLSDGCEEEKGHVILYVNSNKKSSGATNLSSPSTLSHFSSVNHSKDKPVDNMDNHSIQGHTCQNYETKDILLTCNQPIEVKHISYDTHSTLRSHHHSNHSMDSSPNYHSNYSVDKLVSHEDTNSTKDVQGNSNGHNNDLFYYKGIQTQDGIKTWDEDVLRRQTNGEELKRASSNASVQMNQKRKKGHLHPSRNICQQIRTFNTSERQTSPIYNSEEIFVACYSQGDSSFHKESTNTGSMIPSQSHAYRKHPTDQTTDGNLSPPCNKNNITDDKQLPKCGQKEEKQPAVREIYICSICEKEFRQSGNFKKHMKSHTESHHYCQCGNCGSEFDDDEKLLQHMQKEHTGSNPYKCEQCDREFRQFNNLCRHLLSHREKEIKCEVCDRKFSEEYYLDMHMGSHTGNRKFGCGVCAREFTSNSDLEKHVDTHPKSELHVCDVCGKGFSKACVLRQHKKIHEGERSYKCIKCNKCYIHRHHLNMHMGSHNKKKMFACKTCKKEFSQISHLNKHERQHLMAAKSSDSSPEESKGREEKMTNTLGNNSIPDELNGVPSNLQQKPKAKPVRKRRSRRPRKKAGSTNSSAYLHASQVSEANPNPSDSGMFEPLSNEATQNVMKQMMYFPLPDHLSHQNPVYMAFAPAFMAVYCTNLYMMNYQAHSGDGSKNDYAQDKSFLNRNPLSYESPNPLSHTRDFSPTVNSARNRPVSSASINKEHNQYFHNSTFTKPVEFLNYNMPVPVNGSFDISLPPTQKRSKYGSIGENDMEDLSSRGSNGSSSPYATSSVSSQPDTLSHSRDSSPVYHLKSTINSMKPLREDQSKLDMFPLEQLGMITSHSNSKHPMLHPLSSSIHSVHKMKNIDSKCDKPVGISSHTNNFPDDCSNQQQRKRLRNKAHYSSNMDFKMRKMLNSPDLARSTAVEDSINDNYRKMKVKDEKLDELNKEVYAEEEKQGEDNTSRPDEISCLKQQIEEVREMIQHEIQKETLDAMNDIEEEEEGRLVIMEQDTEIQAHDNKIFVAENAKLEKRYSVVCQNEMFSQRKQHDWKNTLRRDTLQGPQIGSICCNKSVVSGDCGHGTYEEKAIQQFPADLRWANNVETSRSHSAVLANSPFDILQPTATLPFQRAANDLDFNDSSGIVLDMSMKHSQEEKQQIHWKQMRDEKSACPACLAPMDTDSNLFKHLADSKQCYELYIAKKLPESASSPSEETVLKLAKKYACQGMRDEGIYFGQKPLEEPMDLTEKASSKIKSRIVENLSDHNESKYHLFCKCCKEPMLNEVALSLHLSKNPRCFHSHYLGRSPVSLRKIDNDCSADSGTLKHIMEPLSGRTSEPTTDRGKRSSLNCDMIASQTIKGSQLDVPVSSQHHLPGWHYMPVMAHNNPSIFSSQPHIYLLQQEALYPVYSGGTLPREQDQSFPLALVKKETSSVDFISTPRNCVGMPVEKIGLEMRKSVSTTEARFCCGICYKSFPSSSDLKAHQNEHVPQKDSYYTCKFCEIVFSRPFDIQCHMLTHKDAYEMHQHNDTTEETRSLRNRKSIEQGHVPKSDLWQHIIAHLGTLDQNPTYVQIGERVKEILKEKKISGDNISLSAINEHLKKYLPVSEGVGTLDDIMALTAELKDFQAGKEKEDDGEANFSSVSDGSIHSSNDESKRGRHNRTKGKRTQKKVEHVCPICNRVLKTKREFDNHLGVHNGERTHICKLCGKGFKKSGILRQHEKIHSSVRPFKCEVFGAYFLHQHHFQTHSHVHNGDKPYKCHICGVGFKHSSKLPKHLEMHKLDSRNQNDNQSKDIRDSKST